MEEWDQPITALDAEQTLERECSHAG
jgi:hypothetical protein